MKDAQFYRAAIEQHKERYLSERNRTRRVKVQGRWIETTWGFTPTKINEELWATLEEDEADPQADSSLPDTDC